MRTCISVARKELHDHLRDIRVARLDGALCVDGAGRRRRRVMVAGRQRTARIGRHVQHGVRVRPGGGVHGWHERRYRRDGRRTRAPVARAAAPESRVVAGDPRGKWIAVSFFALGSLTLTLAGFARRARQRRARSSAAAAPQLFAWMSLGLIPLAFMGAAMQLLVAARCRSTQRGTVLADDGGLRADDRGNAHRLLSGMGRPLVDYRADRWTTGDGCRRSDRRRSRCWRA